MAQGFQVKRSEQPRTKQSLASKPKRQVSDYQQEIEAYWKTDQQENPEQYILAWQAGVYNPLGPSAERNARPLEAHEAEWLFLAKAVGWLQVEKELDAIYFTAPPPNFDLSQADWYLRPDLTTWLEEPELLKKAIAQHPIPAHLRAAAIERHTQPAGWDSGKVETLTQVHPNPSSSERL